MKNPKEKYYWHVWQLALDRETYGDDAGKNIVVDHSGNLEICGITKDAESIVKAHNKAVDRIFKKLGR